MALTRTSGRAVCRGIAETQLRASRLAPLLRPGDVICLYGELGAGKTYFTKGLVAGLGGDPDEVTSPTFVLMQKHAGRLAVHHFDAYRLRGAADFADLGSDEIMAGEGVTAVEWADRVPEALPADRLEVHLAATGPTERLLRMIGRGDRPAALVRELIRDGLLEGE